MPKKPILPKRETITGQMPAVRLEGDLAARADELKKLAAEQKRQRVAAPVGSDLKGLHDRFDTLEGLVREAITLLRERVNALERNFDGQQVDIDALKASRDDHETRIQRLERERKN